MVTHLRSFLEMLIVGQPGTGENQWPQAELHGTLVDSHMLLAFPAFKAKINDGPALRNCLQWTACDKGPVNTSHTCPWKLKHTLLGCIVLLKRDRLAKRLKSQSLPLELQEGCNEKT